MYLYELNSSIDTPLLHGFRLLPRNLTSPAHETCKDIDNCRTLYNIVASCVATILACTWVAIHPNIPPQDSHWTRKLGRRLVTTVYAIIAPELVVLWAAKQWITSRKLADRYHESHEWTQTHGFLAIMGGLAIYKGNKPFKVVDPYWDLVRLGSKTFELTCESCASLEDRLSKHHCECCTSRTPIVNQSESLPQPEETSPDGQLDHDQVTTCLVSTRPKHESQESRPDVGASSNTERLSTDNSDEVDISTIPFPQISEAEIRDKSKGDWISKGLATLQTSWFIVQCIARAVQKLPVTELELATCAFAALNAVTYSLWWNKPQSVDCPHPVARQPIIPTGSSCREMNGSGRRNIKAHLSGILKNVWHKDILSFFHIKENTNVVIVLAMLVLSPLAPLYNMISGDELTTDSKCVGPYYAGDLSNDTDGIIPVLVLVACSTVFGAIHCIGWSFEFPSRVDQLIWRSSSLAITCLPLIEVPTLVLALPNNLEIVLGNTGSEVLRLLAFMLMITYIIAYIVARFTLLVLAFVALKELPPEAYQTVSWTNFIPHI